VPAPVLGKTNHVGGVSMKHLGVVVLATSLVGLPLTAALAQSQSPSRSPASSTRESSSSARSVQIAANSIIGSKVRNPDGKEIGEVSQLMIDPQQGKITSVVVSMGGTLGIGAKEVTVPWEHVKVARDRQNVVVTMDQTILQQAPPTAEERQQQQRQQQPRTTGGDQGSPSASPPTSGGSSAPPPQQQPPPPQQK
ncbi:MAG: PRC-barrel domain-containing protein, partial [Candidatus Rokuibacteriota bacterium]